MKWFMNPGRRMFMVGVCVTLGLCLITNVSAANKRKPRKPKPSGRIEFLDDTRGPAIYKLEGFEEQVGRFTAHGELDFVPGTEEGTLEGTGVVILTAGCDRLVGVATAELDSNTSEANLHFSWRDSITLRNGKTVSNTGRFRTHRPTGLVVVATAEEAGRIISILIRIILRT